jgi:hypothetical protein
LTPYFALLSVPLALSLLAAAQRQRRAGWPSLLLVFTLYLVFIGGRYQVGPDWPAYAGIHAEIRHQSLRDTLGEVEPLSYGLFWLAQDLGYGMYLSNVVAAAILLLGVLAFARQTPNPHLAIVIASPFVLFIIGMSAVRQSMAIGILFFLFSIWRRTGPILRLALIALASLFHVTAAVLVVLALPEWLLARPRALLERWWAPWQSRWQSRRQRRERRRRLRARTSRHSRWRRAARRAATRAAARPESTRPRAERGPLIRWGGRALIAGLVALAVYYSFIDNAVYRDAVDRYSATYIALDGPERVVSPGALPHLSLVLLPVLFLILQHRRIRPHLRMRGIVWAGALLSLANLPLFLISSTGASRMIVYFYFVPMMVYPAVALSYGRATAIRVLIALAIGGLHFGLLAVWLLYANNSWQYLPYQNLLALGRP